MSCNSCSEIKPSSLQGGEFNLNLGSAQVKSAILFAGLYAEGETKFRDRKRSRNHTEIMLANFTENIVVNEETILSGAMSYEDFAARINATDV